MLRWLPTDLELSRLTGDERRAWGVTLACALSELGAEERWPGRREDYRNAVAYGEPEPFRSWVAPSAVVSDWNRSSCGLVVRRVWAAAGVDGHGLLPPYKPGMVLADLEFIARAARAWREWKPDGELPQPGDAIFRGDIPHQHVCTLVQVTPTEAEGMASLAMTVDGGQGGGMGGGTEIAHRNRYFREEGAGLWMVAADGSSKWPVKGWASFADLPFKRPLAAAEYYRGLAVPPTPAESEPERGIV